ncbi:LysR family transcriptional regulator [Thermoflavimicrobium daqui]|uniref:LysR family transcriptional regulator n=1 Tax=Thermoflavimicrobium daqui TaxID=2137476 RepID=A0A364K7K0_9BACL|nr:LysR family transcriptional regulator [Thermoflavimicrobium daqui]RAL26276.1 LysR family transcriptional regulator [Thermoflavimicrobium daqui]
MDLQDLKIFQIVAQEQSISKAAQKLNYVQSNVTNRIKQLEKELHTTLFYRHSRGVQITSAGKTLLSYTEKILHMLDETIKAVRNETSIVTGSLSLGSTESTAAVRLPPVLTQYCQTYPQVDCSLETASSTALVEHVFNYKLDGAFVPDPIQHPDLSTIPIWHEELVVVSHLSETDPISLLQQKPILVFGVGCAYRARLEKWLHEAGIIPKLFREFSSIDTILGCIQAGLGIGITTRSILEKYQQYSPDALLYPHSLPPSFAQVCISFIHRHDVFMSKALHAFIQLIKKQDQLQ